MLPPTMTIGKRTEWDGQSANNRLRVAIGAAPPLALFFSEINRQSFP